jgi:hypothetical protein
MCDETDAWNEIRGPLNQLLAAPQQKKNRRGWHRHGAPLLFKPNTVKLEEVQTALHLWVKILLQLSGKYYDPHQARERAAQQALATASSGTGAAH